ncbi:ABC transporter permease [Nocardioides jensenii]|uniref:ABC transporter permease n=1 Tax=Nocardioides jensenii TaxID=1843 RepID=UPI000834E2F7|nr:ABC transporter permease [Nocardioides jensenii]
MTTTPSPLATLAAEHGLRQVGVRPPLRRYLATMWQRRHFAVSLAGSKAYARNQGNYLGQVWALLNPVLWALVYLLVFGVLLDTSRGVENFIGFLVVGVFMFHFSSASITTGSNAIVGNQGLITSLQFPRALLPIASVLAELVTLVPALVVLLVLVPLTGEPFAWTWLLLPLAVGLQWIFGTGVALVCARLVSQWRDVKQLIPFVLRALMYVSGVFFSIDHYVGSGTAAAVLSHQPVAVYLELVRGTLLSEVALTPALWGWAFGWALLTLVLGFIFFWHAEERYGRG